jgi:hypothetical protein
LVLKERTVGSLEELAAPETLEDMAIQMVMAPKVSEGRTAP